MGLGGERFVGFIVDSDEVGALNGVSVLPIHCVPLTVHIARESAKTMRVKSRSVAAQSLSGPSFVLA